MKSENLLKHPARAFSPAVFCGGVLLIALLPSGCVTTTSVPVPLVAPSQVSFFQAQRDLKDVLQKAQYCSMCPLNNLTVSGAAFSFTAPASRPAPSGSLFEIATQPAPDESGRPQRLCYCPYSDFSEIKWAALGNLHAARLKSAPISYHPGKTVDGCLVWHSKADADRFASTIAVLRYYSSCQPLVNDAPAFADFQQKVKAWRALPARPPLPDPVHRCQMVAEDAVRNLDFDRAADYYEQGLAIEPLWPAGQLGAAQAFGKMDAYSMAALHIKRYLELAPDARDAKACGAQWVVWEENAKNPPPASSAQASVAAIRAQGAAGTAGGPLLPGGSPEASFQGLSLESLLAFKDPDPSIARARNRALLDAKAQSLPGLLRDKKTDELTSLTTQIEQVILDLNHESETCKDHAQQAVERGSAGANQVADLRELSLAYKERIEVLKPILTAVKEEITNRNR
jgi:hypothetical protein